MTKQLFIDVHGVLLDFRKGVEAKWPDEQFNPSSPVRYWEQMRVPENVFGVSLGYPAFWSNLPAIRSGIDLLAALRSLCRDLGVPVVALTRPLRFAEMGLSGVYQSLYDLNFTPAQIILASHKAHCAPGFLIDDEAQNIRDFRAAGGLAFLWPSATNDHSGYSEHSHELAKCDVLSALLCWATNTAFPQSLKHHPNLHLPDTTTHA